VVKIEINNKPTHVTMKLGGSGEGYFEEEVFQVFIRRFNLIGL